MLVMVMPEGTVVRGADGVRSARESLTRLAPRVLCALILLCAALPASAEEPRLIAAVKTGDRAAVTMLARDRALVNATEPDGTSALHWAVRDGYRALVRTLLDAGADLAHTNRYGVTALM